MKAERVAQRLAARPKPTKLARCPELWPRSSRGYESDGRRSIPIAERPPEVDDRRVPGHWEGDLLIGAEGKSAIATLVERHTRYVLLARLGYDRSTSHVIEALQQRIRMLPAHLVKSLARARRPPASHQPNRDPGLLLRSAFPWQRGSNENTNGLLRQHLPRKLGWLLAASRA